MEIGLKEKTVTLDRDGQKLPVFCVEPEADRQLPAIIVLQEIFGVDDHLRDVSRRFRLRQGMSFCSRSFRYFAELPCRSRAAKKIWIQCANAGCPFLTVS